MLQRNRLSWFGHVQRKDGNDCVKKYVGYETCGHKPRGEPKKTRSKVVSEDLQVVGFTTMDALDRKIVLWLKRTCLLPQSYFVYLCFLQVWCNCLLITFIPFQIIFS